MILTVHRNPEIYEKIFWDFFAEKSGKKEGYIAHFSNTGCLIKTKEPIENRRWIRLILKEQFRNLYWVAVGRVVRQISPVEFIGVKKEQPLFHHGVEFISPKIATL